MRNICRENALICYRYVIPGSLNIHFLMVVSVVMIPNLYSTNGGNSPNIHL